MLEARMMKTQMFKAVGIRPAMALCLAVSVWLAIPATAQEADGPILFTNVNVFDGVHEKLIENANVVVTGNLITKVTTEPQMVAGGRVIDGGGRTLMPGLTDAHWHVMHAHISSREILVNDLGDLTLAI